MIGFDVTFQIVTADVKRKSRRHAEQQPPRACGFTSTSQTGFGSLHRDRVRQYQQPKSTCSRQALPAIHQWEISCRALAKTVRKPMR